MAKRNLGWLDTIRHRRSLAQWRAAAQSADYSDLDSLRKLRARARALKAYLDDLTFVADSAWRCLGSGRMPFQSRRAPIGLGVLRCGAVNLRKKAYQVLPRKRPLAAR